MNISYYFWLFSVLLFIPSKKAVHGESPTISFQETDKCECGFGNTFTSRIVGGKETLPHEFPWMVAIFYKGLMHCGGTLINDRYVLTAGHCLRWAKKENLTAVLGLHDRVMLEKEGRGGLLAEIQEIILHEKFTSLEKFDVEDIGLIKLKNPVLFSMAVQPVCLPKNADETYANKTAQVTGWGRVATTAGPSRFLKEADMHVMSNAACKKAPLIGKYIIDIMMCAYKDETDACQGDSGGPLTYGRETGQTEQIGVVSWGIGCAKPGIPGVYTRVTSYLPWIAKNTADAIYCKNGL